MKLKLRALGDADTPTHAYVNHLLTLWVLVRDRCKGTGLGVELWLGRK